jgi:hypothetical protein
MFKRVALWILLAATVAVAPLACSSDEPKKDSGAETGGGGLTGS